MRPLELQVENFRSYYGGPHAFDFRGRSLVGIVGPIGAGKSSLLDAVAFALYGRTPNAGASTRALINQRARDGGVQLRFEVDGAVWEVVRRLRRQGQSQHALYRYAADTADAEPLERITLEAEVTVRITALLGLDFDAFGRSVLLAQGRFAEFLRSRPAERDAVLKGVFGHDRIDAMREAAKDHGAALAAELGEVTVRTEQLDRVAARLAATRQTLTGVEERLETLRKAEPGITDLEGRATAAEAARTAASSRIAELRTHAGLLPDLETAGAMLTAAGRTSEQRRSLGVELAAASAEVASAETALAAARTGGEEALLGEAGDLLAAAAPHQRRAVDAARRVAEIEGRLAAERKRAAHLEAAVTAAGEAHVAASDALEEAGAAVAAAEEAHDQAQHRDMAQTLRAGLTVGERCPVCEQTVATAPAAGAVDLAATETALAAVRARRTAAERARSEAAARHAAEAEAHAAAVARCETLVADLFAATAEAGDAQRELEATNARLGELLGAGDPRHLLEERRRHFAELGEALAVARRRVEQVRGRHDQVIRDEQEAGKRLAAFRVGLVELATRLDRPLDPRADDPEALLDAAEALVAAWAEVTGEHEAAMAVAGDELTRARAEIAEALASIGVEGTLEAALAATAARQEHLAGEIERDAADVAAADELLAERDRLAAARDRFGRLASDLTDARFVRFLLDEERMRLSDLGSDHFQRLTSGRYRFTDDGTFAIVDLNAADAVRKASSLSGGETFLASLALALSLAEMVTRTGGRLDAFFLDEGFGSLDPEHLDLAMDGIEALVAEGGGNRLVVVVSHVPELRHRIEDLIQLEREPLTGDTRILRS